MDPRIENKPEYRFIGKKQFISSKEGKALSRIPELWDEAAADGTLGELRRLSDGDPGIAGLCMDYKNDGFTYFISASSKAEAPSGMEEVTIEPASFAVFGCSGAAPDAMKKTWKDIYNEWFPKSGYEHADAPEIEVYPEGDRSLPGYTAEIWIPVVPAKPRTLPERSESRGKFIGLLLGCLAGIAMGASSQNPPVYLLLGLVAGIAAGAAWDSRKKKTGGK
jgi:AraC family transcriptional regulator